MESLISINNQTTHGLPVLNGEQAMNFVVYPASQIGNLPSTFLGTSKSAVDACFYFAAGAVPAQANYETCMSEEVATSHAAIFYQRLNRHMTGYTQEFLNVLGARKTNALIAANAFLASVSSLFGANGSALQQCQIMCFGTEAETQSIVWVSRILDLSGKPDRAIKALLVPFLMGREVDTVPEGLEGSDTYQRDENQFYDGVIVRMFSPDAIMENVPGRHFDFAMVLYDLFVSSRGGVSWVVNTTSGALQREFLAKLDGLNVVSRDPNSLFWFQSLLQEYINRHSRTWSSLWDRSMSGQPSSFITEHAWLALRESPEVKFIIRHIRSNGPVSATFLSKTRKLSRLAIDVRPLPPARTQTLLPQSHPLRVNRRLQENVLGMPMNLQKLAASISPLAWENLRPFRNAGEFREWLEEYGNYQDPENDVPVARGNITAWPLWPLILSTNPHNNKKLGDWELENKATSVLRAIMDRPDKVAIINRCLDSLQHYREWWNRNIGLKGKINYRPAHVMLESFLRAYQSN